MLQSVKLDTPKVAVKQRDKTEDPSDPDFSGVLALMAGSSQPLPSVPKTPEPSKSREPETASSAVSSASRNDEIRSQAPPSAHAPSKTDEKTPPQRSENSREETSAQAPQRPKETTSPAQASEAAQNAGSSNTAVNQPSDPGAISTTVETAESIPSVNALPAGEPVASALPPADAPVLAATTPVQATPQNETAIVQPPPVKDQEAPQTSVVPGDNQTMAPGDPRQPEIPATNISPESPAVLKTKKASTSQDVADLPAESVTPEAETPLVPKASSAAQTPATTTPQDAKAAAQVKAIPEATTTEVPPLTVALGNALEANSFSNSSRDKQEPVASIDGAHVSKHPVIAAGDAVPSVQVSKVTADIATASSSAARPASMLAQVEGSIRWMLNNHEKSAELQLHPENLGRITISLKVEGQEVHARVWASEATTVTVLQEHRSFLEESLKQQGLNLGSFDLQSGHRGEDARWNTQTSASNLIPEAIRELESKQDVPRIASNFLGNPHRIEILV